MTNLTVPFWPQPANINMANVKYLLYLRQINVNNPSISF